MTQLKTTHFLRVTGFSNGCLEQFKTFLVLLNSHQKGEKIDAVSKLTAKEVDSSWAGGTDWHDISWKIDLYIRSKATFITNICGILTIFLFNHSLNKQEKIAISRRPNSGRDFANVSTECNEIYDVWENHNILTQQGVFTQRLKYSFICNLLSWVRVFIVLSPFYLVSFFYWLGSK